MSIYPLEILSLAGKTLFHQRDIYIYIYIYIYLSGKIRIDKYQQNLAAGIYNCFRDPSFYILIQLFTAHRMVKSDLTEFFAFRTYEGSDFGRTLKF